MLISQIFQNQICPNCNKIIDTYVGINCRCELLMRLNDNEPIVQIFFNITDGFIKNRICITKKENKFYWHILYNNSNYEFEDQDFLSFYNNLKQNLIFQ